jgi:PAS domain S-box-containing protein
MDENEIYNQISQLNNELINTQRNLVKTNRDLEYQIERFRVTLQNITDPVIVTDANFNVVLTNQNAISFTGNKKDMIGRPINEVLYFEEIMQDTDNETFRVSEHRSQYPLKNKEMLFISANHNRVFVELSVSPIKENPEKISGYVIIIHSIDERKKIELRQTEIKDFLYMINKILRHDILNFLNVIQMAIYLSKEKSDFTYLDKAMKSVESSIKLVNDMKNLEYTISKGGNLDIYSVREVIEDVSSNYTIEFNIIGNGDIVADEAIYSVFDNLIRNAIKHGNTKKMRFVITDKSDHCQISVRDYGNGIDNDVIDKIFDENFTHGTTGNTGLGLYIVKKVIERYGGDIWVKSEKEKGTTFTIKIPGPN